ncbi:MAG: cob(I)yrinic acid a,c-diamide adenosyltransferase [Gemmatimonadetes bacterium]|nr:cob(I)yrinic acid a,c-diamide adenosyltransferase [Gemmatimonadota bacterium]NIQ56273.1 cob(I)yrinic acid a,c-diamide adenosyltransferase [Gemmatimonadota bacterium]NIU76461.1 cob(I)yrinic acid a,c-diamide adenosyltransferase [Gammaproteobacteria bacterium]NIX45945.1 cob(I)yrinic acid a,c-diamide adenosyltransferase [Gemmatimonadota bacterium]NIY10266.1 cob(I)yrinic acid a,c-diamide adenosyltransferase [Gemmatimonadota bacterium]
MKGYIQVYTGNGKGKTTAALGQAVRSAGAGLRTFIVQLMKEYPYSELVGLEPLADAITLEQYGGDAFVYRGEAPGEDEKAKAAAALARAVEALEAGRHDVVVLDEVCAAIYFGLITTADVLAVLDAKPDGVELVLTGRYCPDEILDRADLVTEMKEVKHYYRQGVKARKGFES